MRLGMKRGKRNNFTETLQFVATLLTSIIVAVAAFTLYSNRLLFSQGTGAGTVVIDETGKISNPVELAGEFDALYNSSPVLIVKPVSTDLAMDPVSYNLTEHQFILVCLVPESQDESLHVYSKIGSADFIECNDSKILYQFSKALKRNAANNAPIDDAVRTLMNKVYQHEVLGTAVWEIYKKAGCLSLLTAIIVWYTIFFFWYVADVHRIRREKSRLYRQV